MESFTDEQNSWFNAVRLEDSHDYPSAALAYIEDASRCLGRSLFARSAMSATCAASCLATIGASESAIEMYTAAALLYEHNADTSIGKSIRESLWSQLHAFEYFTLVSDHVSAERASKKYADLARRVDRYDSRTVFETLKNRRENILLARANLNSPSIGIPVKSNADANRIQRSMRSYIQQVQSVISSNSDLNSYDENYADERDDDSLIYESAADLNERSIVS
jgi:hypothetical protein